MKKILLLFIFSVSSILPFPPSKEEKEDAFKKAVLQNNIQEVKNLVALGVDPKKSYFNFPGSWAPWVAAIQNYWEILDFFLTEKNFSQKEKNTLLENVHHSRRGQEATANTYQILIKHGANLAHLSDIAAHDIREYYLPLSSI